MAQSTVELLRDLIVENLDVSIEPSQVGPHTPLFKAGLNLDSVAIVELICLIEDHCRFEFSTDDFVPVHFEHMGALARLVDSKRKGGSACQAS